MTNTKDEKKLLREKYRALREAIPAERRAALDARIMAHIEASASYRYAKTLLAYAPIGAEIDIMPLLSRALASGRRIALPRTRGHGEMTFHYVTSLSELISGKFGIREPREDAPLYTDTPLCLCLVPGVTYDLRGYRIGYGGGYYDRFLRQRQIATLGLIYSESISPRIPAGRYDCAVRALATENGILPTK